MKSFIKIILFFAVMGLIAIKSKTISNKIVDGYSDCVSFMSNNTIGSSILLGA